MLIVFPIKYKYYKTLALNCTVMGQEAHYINVGILPHKTDEVFLHEIFP